MCFHDYRFQLSSDQLNHFMHLTACEVNIFIKRKIVLVFTFIWLIREWPYTHRMAKGQSFSCYSIKRHIKAQSDCLP